jgi:hypothetical protein
VLDPPLSNTHKHGYTALLQDGNHARVGNICGKQLLGEDRFTSMQRELETRQRHAALSRIISSAQFDPQATFDGLRPWIATLKVIKAAREAFSYAGDLVPAIREAAISPLHHLPSYQKNGVFVLHGGFFLIATKESTFMREGIAALKVAITAYRRAQPTDSDLHRIVSNSREAHSKLSMVADIFADYMAFRDPHNLRMLGRWSRQFPGSVWVDRQGGRGLRTSQGYVIRLPELLDVNRAVLDRLKPNGARSASS